MQKLRKHIAYFFIILAAWFVLPTDFLHHCEKDNDIEKHDERNTESEHCDLCDFTVTAVVVSYSTDIFFINNFFSERTILSSDNFCILSVSASDNRGPPSLIGCC